MTKTYLGIDPGLTTGAVHINEDLHVTFLLEIKGGADGFLEFWSNHVRNAPEPSLVVCESFHTREGKHGVDTTPLVVIGALKALCEGVQWPVLMQPPGGRLKRMPDWAMKNLGLYPAGRQNRNCREALRHVLSVMKTEGNPRVLAAFK